MTTYSMIADEMHSGVIHVWADETHIGRLVESDEEFVVYGYGMAREGDGNRSLDVVSTWGRGLDRLIDHEERRRENRWES